MGSNSMARDAQGRQVIGDFRSCQAGVGATQGLRHPGMPHREAAYMGLVDDGVFPGRPASRGASPSEGRIDDAALEIELGAVALVEGEVVVRFHLVAEQGGVPLELSDGLPGVGVEQQLVGIEAVAGGRLVGAMDAVTVDRARSRIRQIAVPDLVGVLRQHDALDLALAGGVEQAELDFCRMRREQGEIDAQAIPRGAERMGQTFRESRTAQGRGNGAGSIQVASRDKGDLTTYNPVTGSACSARYIRAGLLPAAQVLATAKAEPRRNPQRRPGGRATRLSKSRLE